ncbi:leucine-rich repeat protein kinase family protein [Actinidia rufa]|uniref:non-specific serine/threonine protein kinase n=1 Tax=Actinidia rufa TaxID=165716 RepID=A0A7J0H3Y0_9ERIC|nr:leucine-rich repeat protein kinase family protein [Actinidia rufa]
MYVSERMLCIAIVLCLVKVAYSATEPNDAKVLSDFRKGLENPELLKWPNKGNDPCGPPSWPHVFCSNGRVTQIQVANLGLKGALPQGFNQLTRLYNLGLQKNQFNGALPTFSGLSELQFAYLDFNEFDSIPADFFRGLSSIRVLALDDNPFNATTGWFIPNEVQESSQLTNFSCSKCNIVGSVPDFFGKLPSLSSLRLSYNRLTGELPTSFHDSMLQVLWLNDQDGEGMTGSIEVIGSMVSLTQVWLHGNQFTGSVPDNIGDLASLKELNLNRNQLVGLIPQSLSNMDLRLLNLNNNMLMGAIPKFRASNVTYASNSFCQPIPGLQCAPEVNALLDFLRTLNYPPNLASEWSGNDPCKGPWLGLSCNSKGEVSIINLQKRMLNGTLSPSLANLHSLMEIHLGGNHIHGQVPANLTGLKSLRLLDITGNNFQPPLPKFLDTVKVNTDGNPLFVAKRMKEPISPNGSPSPPSESPSNDSSFGSSPSPSSDGTTSSSIGSESSSPSSTGEQAEPGNHKRSKVFVVVAAAAGSAVMLLLFLFSLYHFKKRKHKVGTSSAIVVHPRDPSYPDNMFKIAVSNNTPRSLESGSVNFSGSENAHVIESGDLVISVQVLRKVTNNFAAENELGRGGFGAVYKGELEDGTKLAVKRMEAGVISTKALDEFQAEIAVLSKVRHRHLVSLLGFSIQGNERLLVYEYMPQGALSRHLFHWKSLNLEPLSWTRRLNIALDVARGMEYLHSLAHKSFIHRDLKSSNILLGDDFHAKVSDFGLVKLAPDGEKSVATRLAGTFGYLAPEYAVTGKITTKADVFSFGVVLMEILTGLVALDEQRSEERRYLAEWFWKIKANQEMLISAIDPALNVKEDIFDNIYVIAELAGHCTARDPYHRPDMGHAVNVLAQLVEKWKPFDGDTEEYSGIDYTLPLPEMLKGWQEAETKHISGTSLGDSKGSIPAMPAAFEGLFTSAEAR